MGYEDKRRDKLTKMQYYVLRKKGTGPPFSETLVQLPNGGYYACATCGNVLFNSSTSFESITPGLIGWPSFCCGLGLTLSDWKMISVSACTGSR